VLLFIPFPLRTGLGRQGANVSGRGGVGKGESCNRYKMGSG
jgi:hypothetical protein